VGGAIAALLVATVQMFLRDAGPLTTIVRAGWTFLGVYVAMFLLVRVFLRASLFQMIEDKRARREERRRKLRERRENPAESAGTAGPSAGSRQDVAAPSESGLPPL
jgi:hypothetical protein